MSAPTTAPAPPTAGPTTSSDRVVSTSHTPVVGDGTTFSSRSRSRWRRARWPLAVVLTLLVVAGIAALARPPVSSELLAPDNPGDRGSQALARVLESRGVEITAVRNVAAAVRAVRPGTTLLVTTDLYLLDEQVETLTGAAADLVLVEPFDSTLELVTGGAVEHAWSWGSGEHERPAGCDDPHAEAAGSVRSDGSGYDSDSPDVTLCFPHPQDLDSHAYAVLDDGERRVTVLGDAAWLMNAEITEDGNAALALRTLGQHERLVWLVQDPMDMTGTGGGSGSDLTPLLPDWVDVLALQALVVLVVVAFWRGRRLGPLVTEDLPVVVRASETTLGRGRLYRRARARGHAAAGLRAATADRAAGRLGLPRSTGGPTLVDAVARATGRPPDEVAHLLYGPPPADDAALLDLAHRLDQMESEVHHS